MMDDGSGLVCDLNQGSRKRIAYQLERKRRQAIARYADSDPNLHLLKNKERPCCHDSQNLKCREVSFNDIKKNRHFFYSAEGKEKQDLLLTRFISAYPPKRERKRSNSSEGTLRPKSTSVKHFLIKYPKVKAVPVCKKFFCFALGISPARVLRVGKVIGEGLLPKEKRGGDRKMSSFSAKRESVREFLGKLQCTESHYGRGKSKRVYLPGDLSIRKLFRLHQASTDANVTLTFFYRIFIKEFNIGFSSPACDVCATCTRLKNEISLASVSEKQNLVGELRIHKIRAKTFYELMKEAASRDDTVSFVFDLQQVHPLPKTPIGEAFYRRQVSFYTFCCVAYSSRNPTFFTWSEVEAKRGSNEIGSALLFYLRKTQFSEAITSVKLFCDGCGGQNRNAHIIHLLCYWLKKESPPQVREMQITFPVRGHSFLPADRAFGRVEKKLKQIPVITTPEEYNNIYEEFGQVYTLGKDWKVYDLKELLDSYSRIGGISHAKRVVIRKFKTRSNHIITQVRCLLNFRFDSETEVFRSLMKKGRNEEALPDLKELPRENSLTNEKKKDILQLLESHFGENWRKIENLKWYEEACTSTDCSPTPEEPFCDCLDEDPSPTHI